MAYTLEDRKCKMCGKNFCPAPQHLYTYGQGKFKVVLCSWTCMLRYEEKRAEQRRASYEKRRKKRE